MFEIIFLVIAVVIFLLLSCVIMVVTTVVFDVFSVLIIIPAFLFLVFGVIFGFGVAVKNTVAVYRGTYKVKGGK